MGINKRHQDALLEWIGSHERLGVAGTVTFLPKLARGYLKPEYLTADEARASVRLYLRRLDRMAFGSAGARKGRQVGAIAVREGAAGWSSKHIHYHFALEVPGRFSPHDWATVARQTWITLRWAGPVHNVFKPTWSDQWLSYVFKDRDKPNYLDAMDYENWRLD